MSATIFSVLRSNINIGRQRLGSSRNSLLRFMPQRCFRKSAFLLDSSELTRQSEADGIRRIVLNNPKKRNALSFEMLHSLQNALTADLDQGDVRCIVLSAEGKVFSAGHDLSELTSSTRSDFHKEIFDFCSNVMLTIQKLPVPVIAQVQGLAAAAGCQLVASCDMVVASDNSTFSTPGASAGLFCSTPGIAVARALPTKVAAYMVLTGLPITAQEALQYGMVNKVVPEDRIEEETMKIASAIVSKSRSVIKLGKRFFYQQLSMDTSDAYCAGAQVMVKNLTLEDTQEGIQAFFQKRLPVWTHTSKKVNSK